MTAGGGSSSVQAERPRCLSADDLSAYLFPQEMTLLEEGARVYKLIGPVLVKQDAEEASQNVAKRLDYIKGELSVPFLLLI